MLLNLIFDEIRIWNVARTQRQIHASLNHNLLGNETGLIGHWRLDEGVGSSASDSIDNGQTATLVGGAGLRRLLEIQPAKLLTATVLMKCLRICYPLGTMSEI